jgi:hypothetical protein
MRAGSSSWWRPCCWLHNWWYEIRDNVRNSNWLWPNCKTAWEAWNKYVSKYWNGTIALMNEWMNQSMNEWTNVWMNEWMNAWTNEWMN